MKNHLPLSAKIALLVNGNMGLIPLILISFGLMFSYQLVERIDIEATIYLSGDTEIGKGRIVNAFDTDFYVNSEPVYGYDYIFESPDGPLEWTSYGQAYYEVGETVEIEYNKDRPDVNRILGTTSSFGGGVTFFAVIPLLVGLIWLGISIKRGLKKIRVISHGKIGRGQLAGKEPTNSTVNGETVYKLTFEFKADDGRAYQVSTKTHKTDELEDENYEVLIYDPQDPSRAFLADSLPWGVPAIVKELERR
ncbi:MAG: hypothetical protein AAF843_13835 [Bacteroidota bacterium]